MQSKEIPIGYRFEITIRYNGKPLTYPILKTWHVPQSIEHFMLLGKRSVLLVQSNRPLLRAKGLKQKRIEYKLLHGEIQYKSLLEDIFAAIDTYIRSYETTP